MTVPHVPMLTLNSYTHLLLAIDPCVPMTSAENLSPWASAEKLRAVKNGFAREPSPPPAPPSPDTPEMKKGHVCYRAPNEKSAGSMVEEDKVDAEEENTRKSADSTVEDTADNEDEDLISSDMLDALFDSMDEDKAHAEEEDVVSSDMLNNAAENGVTQAANGKPSDGTDRDMVDAGEVEFIRSGMLENAAGDSSIQDNGEKPVDFMDEDMVDAGEGKPVLPDMVETATEHVIDQATNQGPADFMDTDMVDAGEEDSISPDLLENANGHDAPFQATNGKPAHAMSVDMVDTGGEVSYSPYMVKAATEPHIAQATNGMPDDSSEEVNDAEQEDSVMSDALTQSSGNEYADLAASSTDGQLSHTGSDIVESAGTSPSRKPASPTQKLELAALGSLVGNLAPRWADMIDDDDEG